MSDFSQVLTLAFQQCVLLALPLSLLAFGIYLGIRMIPYRIIQCLVPLIAGIVLAQLYASMNPSNPGESSFLLFLTGSLIHPLLILPPILMGQKYLAHLPILPAGFLAIFFALCLVITWGILQGSAPVNRGFPWNVILPVISDLLAATIASGLVIAMDRVLTTPGDKGP